MNDACASPHVLAGFIAALLCQVRHFACMAGEKCTEAQFREHALSRLQLLKLMLLLPSTRAVVESQLAGEPYVYNTVDWPEQAPLAGYFDGQGPVSAEAVLGARINMWGLHFQDSSPDLAVRRLLRAALWMVHTQGLPAAVRFLLDLQSGGFVFDAACTIRTLTLLLGARRRVASDEELVSTFLASQHLAHQGWIQADFLDANVFELFGRPVLRTLHDDVDLIVRWAEAQIDTVVDATGYDAWALGQLRLRDAMNAARGGLEALDSWEDVAYAASTVRIEEVRADAFAMRQSGRYAVEEGGFAYAADFSVAEALVFMLVRTTPDWQDRLFEERALVPAALESLLLHQDGVVKLSSEALPEGWQRLSPEVAALMSACVNEDPYLAWARTRPHDHAQVQAAGWGGRWLDDQGIVDADLREAWLSLACGMDSADNIASVRDRQMAWTSRLEKGGWAGDRRQQLLRQLRLRIAADELHHWVEVHATTADEPDVALQTWRHVAELYPYFDPGLCEQAIALDRLGRPDEALPLLLDAILLRPQEELRWQSLAVMLHRQGWSDESALCQFYSQQLARPEAVAQG